MTFSKMETNIFTAMCEAVVKGNLTGVKGKLKATGEDCFVIGIKTDPHGDRIGFAPIGHLTASQKDIYDIPSKGECIGCSPVDKMPVGPDVDVVGGFTADKGNSDHWQRRTTDEQSFDGEDEDFILTTK